MTRRDESTPVMTADLSRGLPRVRMDWEYAASLLGDTERAAVREFAAEREGAWR